MKKLIVMMCVLAFAGVAYAADTIDFPAKPGTVHFNHKQHMALGCTKCHATEKGGKIAGFGKEWAHKTCVECHKTGGKGPTKCMDCHKK